LADKGGVDYGAIMQSVAPELVSIRHTCVRLATINLSNVCFMFDT
jgi:hypothetical protein